jgi:hypothetical protein
VDRTALYVTQSTKNSVSAFDITTPTAAAYLGTWGGVMGAGNGQLNRPLGIATDGLEHLRARLRQRPDLRLHTFFLVRKG